VLLDEGKQQVVVAVHESESLDVAALLEVGGAADDVGEEHGEVGGVLFLQGAIDGAPLLEEIGEITHNDIHNEKGCWSWWEASQSVTIPRKRASRERSLFRWSAGRAPGSPSSDSWLGATGESNCQGDVGRHRVSPEGQEAGEGATKARPARTPAEKRPTRRY
jgi:hypothetical protein